MITKVFLVLITSLLLVASDEVGEEDNVEIPSSHNPRLMSDPAVIEATIEESVTFPCEVDDLGDYVLLWKSGKHQILFAVPMKVTRDERFSIVDATSLRISSVVPKDSGEYICQVSTNPLQELKHVLNVLYPPSVEPVPKSGKVVAKEGEKVTLACNATANPEPIITWKRLGNYYESANGKSFVLHGVQKNDSGEYECIARNKVGSDTAIITLEVVSAPKIFAQPESGRIRVNEGEPVSMSCEAIGDPTPEIMWRKEGSDEFQSEGNNGKIVIPEASRNHAGTYECIASNSLGISTSFEIKVEVLYAPEIKFPIQSLHTVEGTFLNLTCTVHGEPPPSVTWKHGDRQLLSNGHHQMSTMGNEHILHIHNMTESDFGQYECSAENEISSASAIIDVTGTPKIPSFTSSRHGVHDRSHTLHWIAESPSPIDVYSLRYKKKSGGDWIPINVTSKGEGGEPVVQSYEITGLEPGTMYEVVVTAHNIYGWSDVSESFEFTTKHEVTTGMSKEPTAAIVDGGMSTTNEQTQGADGNGACLTCRVSFLAIVAQVLVLSILHPFLL